MLNTHYVLRWLIANSVTLYDLIRAKMFTVLCYEFLIKLDFFIFLIICKRHGKDR